MQALGGLGRRGGRNQRREGVVKVIGQQQRVEVSNPRASTR
jgi:hypothetical protein